MNIFLLLLFINCCNSSLKHNDDNNNINLSDHLHPFFKHPASSNIHNYTHQSNHYRRSNTWPNGQIYFSIDNRFGYHIHMEIYRAIVQFHRLTCLNFEQIPVITDDNRYDQRLSSIRDRIHILPDGGGCYSSVGRIGGVQSISLDKGCFNTQSIIRLLMYAIGFLPEHNRPDRDQFIKIFYDHIDSDNIRRQFEKRSYYMLQDRLPYDYSSVMHFSGLWHSIDGKLLTMRAREVGRQLGRRPMFKDQNYLSEIDIAKIRLLYRCRHIWI